MVVPCSAGCESSLAAQGQHPERRLPRRPGSRAQRRPRWATSQVHESWADSSRAAKHRKRCRAPELREDTVNLAKSRTGCRRGMGFKRTDDFEELFAAEHAGATELGVGARCNQARHSSDMVVVPMRRDDQGDSLRWIHAESVQVLDGDRGVLLVDARVDDDPRTVADMQHDTLAIAGPEEGDLELVLARRHSRIRHNFNARTVSRAQVRPSRRSEGVIAGRSRNTICDTRFLVPLKDRSYPITQRKILPSRILPTSLSESSVSGMIASSSSWGHPPGEID